MGKPDGFIAFERHSVDDRPPDLRANDFDEFHIELDAAERQKQGARCMDCGIPFCHSDYGCPVDNLIPEWNDLIYHGRWEEAFYRLRRTNNFPEYTGRVCPAPCESACVLGINEPPVTIKDNECAIADRAYSNNLMEPRIPKRRSGKRVAIVGSGPAGLAAADQLNQAGHLVTLFERDDRIGGLLMYGIPNMKLDKGLVESRNRIMAAEGIEFRTGVTVGADIDPRDLQQEYDALLLTCGATEPRDLPVTGRATVGVHFAMEYLRANTKSLLDSKLRDGNYISARDKRVIVIGGGDTGNDCIGTAVRHKAAGIVNFELLPRPANQRTTEFPWPVYPRLYKQDYGHEEVAALYGDDPRTFGILTKEFIGNGRVEAVRTVRVRWSKPPDGRPTMQELPNSEEVWHADLVLLALGFLGPEQKIVSDLQLATDARSNIAAAYGSFRTSQPKVFAAGDARRGQSLVVWAIKEGRGAAREIDRSLMGTTLLP